LYHAVTLLELLSGVLLGDALRRIKKTLNSMPHLMSNQKTFWLHVCVLVSHCVIFTISQLLIFRAFDNPSPKNLKLQVWGRIALFTSMCVLQSIMLYMFWKFTRPAFRRIKVASSEKKA